MNETARRILECFAQSSGTSAIGGLTAEDVVDDANVTIGTARRYLRRLTATGYLVSFAPHSWDRADGKTARTQIYKRTRKELPDAPRRKK